MDPTEILSCCRQTNKSRFISLFIVFENVENTTNDHNRSIERELEHVDIYYGQFKYPAENVHLFFLVFAICSCSDIDNSSIFRQGAKGRSEIAREHHINIRSIVFSIIQHDKHMYD